MENQMMYEKNVEYLKKAFGNIKTKINSVTAGDMVVCEYETQDKHTGLYIQNQTGIIQLNSQYSSGVYANLWAEHILEKEELGKEHVIVVFGLGNGDYLKALVNKIPDGVVVVCYEPSYQIFLKTIEHIDLEEVMQNKVLLFIEDINMDIFDECWRTMVGISNGSLIHAVALPVYPRIFCEKLNELISRIQKNNEWIQVTWNTKKRFSHSFSKNQIAMLPYLLKSYNLADLIQRLPRNYPAIVVAAGPSLKKNIKEIKNAKNKAMIIAIDTSINLLLKEGIVPDIYVTIDPEKPLELFGNEQVHQIPVCICPYSVRDSFEKQKNKTFISLGDTFIGRFCQKYEKPLGFLGSGGTVAQDAFSLALRAGMNPIILVGQDLAYTDDETHVKGAYKTVENVEDMDENKFLWVEDIYGNQVKTIYNLTIYKKWYEDMIAEKISKDIRVIDATEGGAKINGTEIMTLKEVIEKECTKVFDYEAVIASSELLFTESEQMQLKEEFERYPKIFSKIQSISKEANNYYERLLSLSKRSGMDVKEVKEIMKKLEKLTESLENYLEYRLIDPYVEAAAENALNNLGVKEEDIMDDLEKVADRGLIMTGAIQNAVPDLMPEIEAMLKVLKEDKNDNG